MSHDHTNPAKTIATATGCADHCHTPSAQQASNPAYRRILWIALIVNFGMFAIEIGAGLSAGSVALLADAVDFLGDAANYALALFVLGLAPIWSTRAAQLKAWMMIAFGLFVLGRMVWSYNQGIVPEAYTMGIVGLLALTANLSVAALLYAYREGNANMRSVWLCTRNDAIGNVAVMLAALGVLGSGTAWPDLFVGLIMAGLALHSGVQILRQAKGELRTAHDHQHAS
jgi:Co/Zn/Cd efflux system component